MRRRSFTLLCGFLAALVLALTAGWSSAAVGRIADDTAMVQGLLDAGGTVTLPAGTYQVSGLVVDQPGTDLRLDPAARLVHAPGSQSVLIKVDADGATVEAAPSTATGAAGPAAGQ